MRNLAAPLGQLAIVHPHRRRARRSALHRACRANVLVASTGALLALVVGAYYWQAGRTREADEASEHLRLRIGAALGRGRCGLWDWDLARGRIYWSHSMYEMLGMPPEDRYMAFGELRKLVHPADADLVGHGRVADGATTPRTFDCEFRIRNASGEWIWLRARAELVDRNQANGTAAHRHRHRHHRTEGAGRTYRAP